MNDEQKEMTQKEAEEDFKNAVADVFSKQVAGLYRDADGFIVIPRTDRKRSNSSDDKS